MNVKSLSNINNASLPAQMPAAVQPDFQPLFPVAIRLASRCFSSSGTRNCRRLVLPLAAGMLGLSLLIGCGGGTSQTGPQGSAPANTVLPAISGTTQVGDTLTTTNGSWANSPASYSYQWNANSTAISGATSSSFILVSADAGVTVTVSVTATNSYGSATATSAGAGPVAPAAPQNTAPPVISGTTQVGDTLTTSNGSWSNSPTSYSYQWYAAGTAISGATSSSYALLSSEVGDTITVTVTATNASGSTPATSAGVGPVTAGGGGSSGGVAFTALHTYYVSPTGNDANSGTTLSEAWATPDHAVDCGDVIIAASGNYSRLTSFGAVSNCPSTSGGLGQGGVYFATLLCGGPLGACTVVNSCTGQGVIDGIEVSNSNWAVEGWEVSQGYTTSCSGFGFEVYTGGNPWGTNTGILHHIAWINNIAYDNANGLSTDSEGANNGSGFGADYMAYVGNITQNSAGRDDGYWDAALDIIGLKNYDTNPGTHIFADGNVGINNQQTLGGASDGECMMTDTLDALDYTQQLVIRNNICVLSERLGLHMFYQGMSDDVLTMKIYNNTFFANNAQNYTISDYAAGEINLQSSGSTMPWLVQVYNNIAKTNWAINVAGGANYALNMGGDYAGPTIGNTGSNPANSQNILKGMMTSCYGTSCDPGDDVVAFNGGSFGVNTYIDPAFNNTSDMLLNQIGVPNCAGFVNTVECLGYNANTQTYTTPSVIYDMTPTASGISDKGYQVPSTTCTPSDPDYPTWLLGVVYLQWNSSTGAITENPDLVTKPCGM